MRRVIALTLVLTFAVETASLFAVDGKKAAYFGGTVTVFATAKDPAEGILSTVSETELLLTVEKPKEVRGQVLRITYAKIEDLEYGQKAGRRVGTAVATTVLLGPIGLLSLFSKKRNHYLTIAYKDEMNKDQVAVLELGKDIVRTTLAVIQTRSGKQIQYQDDEAREASQGL